MRTVADDMQATPATVGLGATLQRASAAMLEHRTHAVVVTDERGRVCGVVSADDVARALAEGHDATRTPVAEILDGDPPVVSPDEPLAEAHLAMRAAQLPAVAVVGPRGRLIGLLIDPKA